VISPRRIVILWFWSCGQQGRGQQGAGQFCGWLPLATFRLVPTGAQNAAWSNTGGATWEADNVHPGAYILAALDWADQRKHRREISERHRHRAAHAHCEKDTELGEEDHGCKQR
jgi:hypothetical protein